MTPNQKSEFLSMLTGVCELYGKVASPEFMALYWQLLAGYNLEDVQRAFHAHAMNADSGMYMPKPGDIVRYIDGGSQTRAARAWVKVDRAMRCVGGGESVVFDDYLIHAALEGLGQWPDLCQTPVDEIHFLQVRFEKRYQALVVNPPSEYQRVLVGRYQSENTRAGFQAAPPVLVGDVDRCKLTYSGGVEPGETIKIHSIGQVAAGFLSGDKRPALRVVGGSEG